MSRGRASQQAGGCRKKKLDKAGTGGRATPCVPCLAFGERVWVWDDHGDIAESVPIYAQVCHVSKLLLTHSPDVNVRRASELELRRMEAQPGMLAASVQIVASSEVDTSIRQAAAIYVKNRIARAWDTSIPRGANESPHVSEEDKTVVRAALLPTIASVPPTLRVHVASALYSVVRCDFPTQWPSLLDDIVKLLTSQEETQMYAGVRALVEVVRAFRFTDTDTKLEEIVSRTFPPLLQTTQALIDSEHVALPAVGEIVYYALKAYKTSMIMVLTKHQQSHESIVPWGTLLLRVVQLPVQAEGNDDETKAKTPWWKAKKWAFYSLNKLFSRYGIPTQLPPSLKSYKPFAETFLNNFAPEILKAYLHTTDAIVSQNQWVSPAVARHILMFFTESIKPKSMWIQLRPHMVQIIESFVYPRLCFSDADEELWELDPVDFVRMSNDPLEELGTPTSAAGVLLNTAIARRTKSMFEPTLAFITKVLNAYPNQCTPRQFDGALRMCITISQTMVQNEAVRDSLDSFFVQHVLPSLKSERPFLRLRACAMVQTFDQAGMKWQSSQSLEAAFRGVMDCIMDTELPVRVQAAEAMGELVAHDEVHNAIAPNAGRLMQELLKLSDETDLDVLMMTQEKIVNNFAEELLPFSVQLTQQMANSYMRLVQDNLAGGDPNADGVHAFNMEQGEEDKYFAALGCLSTMYQMVTTAESRPEILAELENVLLPIVAYTIETETIDLYDDCFQLTDVLTYYQKRISPAMWNIFTLMYKSFKSSGIDYLSEMIGTFDNCASYGTAMLQENAEYRHMLLDIFHTAMSSDQLVVGDRISACQIAEVVLLLLKGYVDEAVPGIVTTLLPHVQKNAESPSFLLRKWATMVILEAIYYNPTLALQVLESQGATAGFFSEALPMLTKFRRVHECKVAIVSLLSLLSLDPASIPEAMKSGYPHLFQALLTQLKVLPKLVSQRQELHKALDEGFEPEDDDGVLDEFDDDADVQEDDNDYLELLAQEAARLRARVASIDGGADNDDDDEVDLDDFDDDDVVYESPLEHVPVYEPFRTVVTQLRTQQGALFESLTQSLNEQQQQDLQQVYDLQDTEENGTTPKAA